MNQTQNESSKISNNIAKNPVLVRSPLSKKLRFNILKKYGFKCRYCGRGHPEIALHVLQIDHVISVAEGGDNHDQNLVAACQDCNLGKFSNSLDPFDICLEYDQNYEEEFDQSYKSLDQYLVAKEKKSALKDRIVSRLATHWKTLAPGFDLSDSAWNDLYTLLKDHQIEDIIKSMEKAAEKHLVYKINGASVTGDSWRMAFGAFKLFCKQRTKSRQEKLTSIDDQFLGLLRVESQFNEKLKVAQSYIIETDIKWDNSSGVLLCDQCNQIVPFKDGEMVIRWAKNIVTDSSLGLIYFSHKKDHKGCTNNLDNILESENPILTTNLLRYDLENASNDLIDILISTFKITGFERYNIYEAYLRLTLDNFDLAEIFWQHDPKDTKYPDSQEIIIEKLKTIQLAQTTSDIVLSKAESQSTA